MFEINLYKMVTDKTTLNKKLIDVINIFSQKVHEDSLFQAIKTNNKSNNIISIIK